MFLAVCVFSGFCCVQAFAFVLCVFVCWSVCVRTHFRVYVCVCVFDFLRQRFCVLLHVCLLFYVYLCVYFL